MAQWHLAQLNVALMNEPLESPGMADFVASLDRINALAESSPGFVWRLQDEDGDATSFRPLGDNLLMNLSVWQDVASLHTYAFRTAHADIMRRRREWFGRMREAHAVLWWVPAGHEPTLAEAVERLTHLRTHGASPHAFTFRDAHPPPDATPGAAAAAPQRLDDTCPSLG